MTDEPKGAPPGAADRMRAILARKRGQHRTRPPDDPHGPQGPQGPQGPGKGTPGKRPPLPGKSRGR